MCVTNLQGVLLALRALTEWACTGHQGFAPQQQVHRVYVRGCCRGASAGLWSGAGWLCWGADWDRALLSRGRRPTHSKQNLGWRQVGVCSWADGIDGLGRSRAW